ncbi:hypothetical protein AAG570_005523 [Ranatra chinensis]|uniref:Uncharacterized protein n=1 Tax=Ranatra chinensis TaxID=642074 RepID=A0ABD0YAJ4_9HEMI
MPLGWLLQLFSFWIYCSLSTGDENTKVVSRSVLGFNVSRFGRKRTTSRPACQLTSTEPAHLSTPRPDNGEEIPLVALDTRHRHFLLVAVPRSCPGQSGAPVLEHLARPEPGQGAVRDCNGNLSIALNISEWTAEWILTEHQMEVLLAPVPPSRKAIKHTLDRITEGLGRVAEYVGPVKPHFNTLVSNTPPCPLEEKTVSTVRYLLPPDTEPTEEGPSLAPLGTTPLEVPYEKLIPSPVTVTEPPEEIGDMPWTPTRRTRDVYRALSQLFADRLFRLSAIYRLTDDRDSK